MKSLIASLCDLLITKCGARTTRVLSRLFFSPGGPNVGVPRTVCDGSLIIVSRSLDTCKCSLFYTRATKTIQKIFIEQLASDIQIFVDENVEEGRIPTQNWKSQKLSRILKYAQVSRMYLRTLIHILGKKFHTTKNSIIVDIEFLKKKINK